MKTVVRNNTAELTANMQAEAGKVLTGHWEGKSLLNLLGQQKKYRYEAFEQWFFWAYRTRNRIRTILNTRNKIHGET